MKNNAQLPLAYTISAPKVLKSPFVFASPHSGRAYPESFLAQSILDPHKIRSSEDAFIDDLCDFVTDLGAPLLCATAPRAYLDLNRGADELDPAVIAGIKSKGHNARVASGLGVIPRVVAHSQPIYAGKVSQDEANYRIEHFWRPYHTALSALMQNAKNKFGYAVLIDLHSMPHEAVASPSKAVQSTQIVLGDRFGSSCDRDISDHIFNALQNTGLCVGRNNPFAGAYITQHYGRPSQNQHAVQIEIDRALYLNENEITPNDGFDVLKSQLKQAFKEIMTFDTPNLELAAE